MRPGWRYALHIFLFILTLGTATLAGVQLVRSGPVDWLALDVFQLPAAERWTQVGLGLLYAGPFLGVLAVHEFGHYFTARYNKVRTSLPFFLPMPFGLGTFGAVIRIKERIFSRREFFDIGLAGPLAGLLVAVPLLIYAFTHLPDQAEYLLVTTRSLARYPAPEFTLAQPLLYRWLEAIFADPHRLPPPNLLLRYPLLVAGEFSLFFTALNLLPIGQLDGGHILYGLLGTRRAGRLSALFFVAFIFYAGLGIFSLRSGWETWLYGGVPYALYLGLVFWKLLPKRRWGLAVGAGVWAAQLAVATAWPGTLGQPGWLVFGLLLGRLSGIYHPAAPDDTPLNTGRRVLGWVMVGLFILCFSSSPLAITFGR
jgi:Zn-dependent protease